MHKVLIIEDNEPIRENLCEILELADYETHAASDGKEGIQLAYQVKPDLILCDVMMPKLDGFGVLKILKENKNTTDIPFIFLTAKGEKEDFRKGMTLGADDYIPKPFDDVELLETVKYRIERSKRQAKGMSSIKKSDKTIAEELRNAIPQAESKNINVKEYLFKQDTNPNWLYYIEAGLIKLYHTNEYGKEIIFQIVGPGTYIGFEEIVSDHKYQLSAVCLNDAIVKYYPRNNVEALILEYPSYMVYFSTATIAKYQSSIDRISDMAYDSVRQKVAKSLLYFSNVRNGLEIIATRDDLANYAGIAKESFVRMLKEFKEEKLISVKDKKIQIEDMETLKSYR